MDSARATARDYVFLFMRRAYGWPEWPKVTDEDGREWDDWGEIGRQRERSDAAFEQFVRWRVERRKELAKEGKKLPGIYVKDKATGYVSVPRDEFERQFAEFLDRRDHPEKYKTANGQPKQEQAAPIDKPWAAHPQPTGTENLSPADQAEQARREIAEGRSILYAELQRIIAANERRRQERERDQQQAE